MLLLEGQWTIMQAVNSASVAEKSSETQKEGRYCLLFISLCLLVERFLQQAHQNNVRLLSYWRVYTFVFIKYVKLIYSVRILELLLLY